MFIFDMDSAGVGKPQVERQLAPGAWRMGKMGCRGQEGAYWNQLRKQSSWEPGMGWAGGEQVDVHPKGWEGTYSWTEPGWVPWFV